MNILRPIARGFKDLTLNRKNLALTLAAQTLFYQLSLMDEYRVRVERALACMDRHALEDPDSEMQLHASLAHLLLHTQGVTGTMLRSFQRGYVLAMRTDDASRRAEAICGMWVCSLKMADFQGADNYVEQLALLCAARDDTAMRLVLARMRSAGAYLRGRYAQSAALARMVENNARLVQRLQDRKNDIGLLLDGLTGHPQRDS